MSRRFNINAKNDRSLGNLNRYNNKVTSQQINNNNDEENETENTNNNGETVFNKPQKIVRTITDNDIGELKDIKIKMPVATKVTLVALIISILLFAFLLVFVTTLVNYDETNNKMATGGYYAMRCPEVNVIFTDKSNNYEPTGTGTYPLEEYVAGVVAGEVGFLGNLEVDKELAIAARTYLLTHDNNCTIESSDRKQVFRELTSSPTDQLARQAAEETKGLVLLKNNELYSVQYDAFCSIKVTSTEYTLKQANQKIPRSWVDSQAGIAAEWKQGNCAGNHGNGLSQWGSLYLATKQNMKYDEILKYYLGDEITISKGSFSSSIANLDIKNTSGAQTLYEPLSSFLPKNGLSVEDMNNYIHTSVANNGAGTRAGVVTAAVSIINYLYDNTGYKLPYYWNGKYYHIGINPNFGGYTKPSEHGHVHAGFDCSGFVSWAIINGGYNFSGESTRGFERRFGSYGCSITSRSCVGEPGDLINESNVHVQLIVSVDEANGVYYIAESANGLNINAVGMHSGSSNKKIIHMDNFYNNEANKNYNY